MAELSPEVRELLSRRNMAHVATLMSDGAPHVSPVWIALEGDRLAIFSAAPTLKIRNLRRDRRVGVSIADEHNPYRSAIIRGRVVEELEGEEAVATNPSFPDRVYRELLSSRAWRAPMTFISTSGRTPF